MAILNPSTVSFQESLGSKIYVDKSEIISLLNEVVKTKQKYVCISRPRRFGKSMTAEMLCAYYGKQNARKLFDGLKIASSETYEKHLNQYNVIHINMLDFSEKKETIKESLNLLKKHILHELKLEYPDVSCLDWEDLTDVLSQIYTTTNMQFVFIIDEWDCVFRRRQGDGDSQRQYLDFLRNILKDKPYIALAYMTGILPIKKYGEHSALNMFDEISIADAGAYAQFTGFTEEEVEELCQHYSMDFDSIRQWYNGYMVEGISIYNPKSVVDALQKHKIGSYWSRTETYEALQHYIRLNMDGLHEKIESLIAGNRLKVDISLFSNDMTTFHSADDVLALLIHLGYLTYQNDDLYDDGECWIPNEEVKREFIRCIKTESSWQPVVNAINRSEQILESTLKGDNVFVAEQLDSIHSDTTSVLSYHNEQSLASTIYLAYYTAARDYTCIRELPSGKGFADIVFVPRRNSSKPAIIVELKWDKDAETAIKQIKEKRYHGALEEYTENLLLVGINYDKNSKQHACLIEKMD